jgi:hypothetical protein
MAGSGKTMYSYLAKRAIYWLFRACSPLHLLQAADAYVHGGSSRGGRQKVRQLKRNAGSCMALTNELLAADDTTPQGLQATYARWTAAVASPPLSRDHKLHDR